jgi:hypothetical protein
MNSRGVLVGSTNDVLWGEQPRATIWMGNQILKLSPPHRTWWAAINDRDWVVGSRLSETSLQRPIMWLPDLGVTALPVSGGIGGWATDINQSGQVVGTVLTPSGSKAVIWRVRP